MKYGKHLTAAVAVIMALAVCAVIISDESDADAGIGTPTDISGFKEHSKGTITIPMSNSDSDAVDVILTVTYAKDTSRVLHTQTVTLNGTDSPEGGDTIVKLSFQLPPGSQEILITGSGAVFMDGADSVKLTIDVEKSIWSGYTIYLIVIILAIVIVIAIAIWVRNRPKGDDKNKLTFTELEAMKKGEDAEPDAGRNAPSTKRRRYHADSAPSREGSKKKQVSEKKEAPAKAEKKPTFTELEAGKRSDKSKKDKPSKKSGRSSEGTEKIKYKSSRRK